MTTYYDLLGVDPDASTDEIRAAYRERLTEVHPDVSDDPDAGEQTRRLITAKEVLTDETDRERYDRLGHDRYTERNDGPAASGGEAETPGSDAETIDWDVEPTGNRSPGDGATTSEPTDSRSTDRDPTAGSGEERRTGEQSGTRADRSHEGNTAWRTQADDAWAVGRRRRSRTTRLDRSGSSLLVLFAAFLLYPLMLWAALFPRFPLVVNVLVGLCLLGEVFYLQSMPRVGAVVFGTWTVLLPLILSAGFGISLGSPIGLVAIFGTVIPLTLSVLTGLALRL